MSQHDVAPWKQAAAFAAVALLTAACFAPALRNDLLIWDDAGYIWENPFIRRLDGDLVAFAMGGSSHGVWMPLSWLSLALDHAVWGLDPTGYHLTNLLLHAANAGLLFLVALALLQRAAGPGAAAGGGAGEAARARWALWGAVLAALLHALHPLRVESVAWATERKDVLSLFFGLLAVLAWLGHAGRYGLEPWRDDEPEPATVPGPRAAPRYWLALGLFALSLLAKPALVTLPLVLLVLDRYPLRRLEPRGSGWLAMEKLPFLALAGLVALAAMEAAAGTSVSLARLDVTSRLLNAVRTLGASLWLTAWPAAISPFYPLPGGPIEPGLDHLLAGAALAAITAACAWSARRRPWFLAAWLAWLLLLFPFAGLVQVGPQALAARFTYAPGPALALLAGAGLSWLVFRQPRRPVAVLAAAAAVAGHAALAAVTVRDLATWKDDVTLWSRVIDLSPRPSARAFLERSNGHARRGDLAAALADADGAVAAAASGTDHPVHELHLARAMILEKLGRLPAALAAYGDALQVAERPARAAVLTARGALYRRLGEPALAAMDFAAAANP